MTNTKTHRALSAPAVLQAGFWIVTGGLALATPAHAQMRGGGGGAPIVVATTLDKVPVGTWAEYAVKAPDGQTRKVRQALVGKDAAGYAVETSGTNGQGDRTLTRMVVDADPTKEGAVKKTVVQMGAGDPMEMPAPQAGGGENRGPGMARRFLKPDAGKLVGKETVKVAAGSFQTEHYKQEGPRGGTYDLWVAKNAGLFGLVKMEMDRPAGPEGRGGGHVSVELAAAGKGAKPELTKAAKPFDREAFRGLWGRGGDRRPNAPATPPAAPTPPEAAKPTPAPAKK